MRTSRPIVREPPCTYIPAARRPVIALHKFDDYVLKLLDLTAFRLLLMALDCGYLDLPQGQATGINVHFSEFGEHGSMGLHGWLPWPAS